MIGGLTAESFWVGVFIGTVVTICCVEIGRALADLLVVHKLRRQRVPERRSSIPAHNARLGGWR